jgi:hypothetical protein
LLTIYKFTTSQIKDKVAKNPNDKNKEKTNDVSEISSKPTIS